MKLLPPRCTFGGHHTSMHQFTVSFYWKPHICRMHACLTATCHLHLWLNDWDLLWATVATLIFEMLFFTDDVLLVEFVYLVFIHMPAKSYCRWSLVCVAVYDIFRAPINFSVHSFRTSTWSVHKEMLISQVTHPLSTWKQNTVNTAALTVKGQHPCGFHFHCHHRLTVTIITLSPSPHSRLCHTITITTRLSPLQQPCIWKHSQSATYIICMQSSILCFLMLRSIFLSILYFPTLCSIFLSWAKVSCTLSAFLQ